MQTEMIIVSIRKWIITEDKQIQFQLQLHSEYSKKNWEINKTFIELINFHQYLLLNFSNLPIFPDIDFAYLNLQKTKVLLELYLTEILQRDDIISNPQTETFLKLKNHFNDFYQYQPVLIIHDLSSSILKEVKELKVFLSSYKNNISVLEFEENQRKFNTIDMKNTKNEICVIQCITSFNITFVLCGLINGVIEYFNLIPGSKMKKFNKKFIIEKMGEVAPHQDKIINFGFDPSHGYIYSSCRNDNTIVISEINYEKIITKIKLNQINSITGFEYDNEQKCIFISDKKNTLAIFKIENSNTLKMIQAFHGSERNISQFKFNKNMNSILIGTNNSEASIYRFDYSSKKINKLGIAECDKTKRFKVVGLSYKQSKDELIVSLSNGKIQFWSKDAENPIFVLDCCSNHKYDIYYNEDKNILISNCVDNIIKIYKLPSFWMGEIITMKYNKVEKVNSIFNRNMEENKNEGKNNINDNEQIEIEKEDEYDSSLDGWDNDDIVDSTSRMLDLEVTLSF